MPPVQLAGIADAWKAGNAAEKRRLLGDLFDDLRVDGQETATFIPRADKAAGVALLIDEATGGCAMAEREGFEPFATHSAAEFG